MGIYNIIYSEGPSGFNNIVTHDITDFKYSKYFGFSKECIESYFLNKILDENDKKTKNMLLQ